MLSKVNYEEKMAILSLFAKLRDFPNFCDDIDEQLLDTYEKYQDLCDIYLYNVL